MGTRRKWKKPFAEGDYRGEKGVKHRGGRGMQTQSFALCLWTTVGHSLTSLLSVPLCALWRLPFPAAALNQVGELCYF